MVSRLAHQAGSDAESSTPLVVDLDGTLVTTDLLAESFLLLIKRQPLSLLQVPLWLAQGKAYFKQQVAERALPDTQTLPYEGELLAYLQTQKQQGRRLLLATASDQRLAREVADRLGLFDEVLASDGRTNLGGEHKRARLVERFGERGFDYAANAHRDIPVWRSARRAILVHPAPGLSRRLVGIIPVERTFPREGPIGSALLETLRLRHWLKNGLVFVPLGASHQLFDLGLLFQAFLTFIAFSLCASVVYVINDLLDLPSDRHHPHKRERPLASGRLPAAYPIALVPLLLVGGLALGGWISPLVLAILAFYVALMLAYSQALKDVAILDVMVLASGYTLRILAGAAAVAIMPSPWLIAFSGFLFFSLALTKRYAELVTMRSLEGARAHARAYLLADRELIATLGVASGHIAVVVLALYISSTPAHHLYSRYQLIWLVCGLLLYWISHLWLIAHRGRMDDDPLVFALKDRTSGILIVLMGLVVVLAI